MKKEDFNTKLSSRFESIRPTILEVSNQLFKAEFNLDHTVIGSGEPHVDINNDSFPKVAISFLSGGEPPVQHVFLLAPELVINLYAKMIEADVEEEVTDAHLEGIKEGVEQILGQVRAILDGDGVTLDVENLNVVLTQDAVSLELEDAPKTGSALSYNVTAGEDAFIVNHYLFSDYAEVEAEGESAGITDEEIENLLNGEDLDDRVSVDDELGMGDVGVQNVEFGDFDGQTGGGNGKPRNIDMLLDVDLEVLVELGRRTMLIKDVLKLGKGSVVELDKAAGDPLGIFVNGRMLAEGEVVVVDDHFGIRITKLAGTAERIKSLG